MIWNKYIKYDIIGEDGELTFDENSQSVWICPYCDLPDGEWEFLQEGYPYYDYCHQCGRDIHDDPPEWTEDAPIQHVG